MKEKGKRKKAEEQNRTNMTRAARSHRISSFDAHSSALFTCRSFTSSSSSFELIPSLIPYFLSFFLLFSSPLLTLISILHFTFNNHTSSQFSLPLDAIILFRTRPETHSLTQSFTHPPSLSCSLPFPILPFLLPSTVQTL